MHNIHKRLRRLICRHPLQISRLKVIKNVNNERWKHDYNDNRNDKKVHIKISSSEKRRAHRAGIQKDADLNMINGGVGLQIASSSSSLLIGHHSALILLSQFTLSVIPGHQERRCVGCQHHKISVKMLERAGFKSSIVLFPSVHMYV